MGWTVRGANLLPAFLFGAACGPHVDEIPAASGDPIYQGTSRSDIWQTPAYGAGDATFHHWDGSAWSTVSVDFIPTTVNVAGDGSVWVMTAVGGSLVVWTLYRVSVDGTAEVVALPPVPAAPFDKKPIYRLYGYRGQLVAVVGGYGLDDEYHEILTTPQLYLREGDGWTALPALPDVVVDAVARVGVDGELMVQVIQTYDGQDYGDWDRCDEGDGPTSPFLRLQGDEWVQIPADPCLPEGAWDPFSVANPIFPIDDVWSRSWRYDGATLGPAPTPPTAGLHYTRSEAGTVRISEQAKGAADPGSAYDCDVYGNCTVVDTFAYEGTEWVAETWDGTAWTHRRVVATGQTCVGAGCVYRGDVPGVVGELEDGTVLIHQPPDGDGGATLAVVTP